MLAKIQLLFSKKLEGLLILLFWTSKTNSVTLRAPRDLSIVDTSTNTTIQVGVGCGFYRMNPQQVIQITSSNYGLGEYFHDEACIWRFVGENCGVSAFCPCFDIPASFKCLGDYLKFTDTIIYDQRFCGDVAPQGIYRSVSGHFRIRFKSDWRVAGNGFLCYLSCTKVGLADPVLPTPICFNNTLPEPPVGEVTIPPVTAPPMRRTGR